MQRQLRLGIALLYIPFSRAYHICHDIFVDQNVSSFMVIQNILNHVQIAINIVSQYIILLYNQRSMNSKLTLMGISLFSAFVLLTYFNYWYAVNQGDVISDLPTADLDCGFTDDFHNFLTKNGYGNYSFERPDIKCGAYGGRATSKEAIKNVPVIFIHGNSDVGFGRGTADGYVSWQTGFRSLATFLSGKGYQKSEMYTTTWGPANPNLASNNSHIKEHVMRLRAFVEAVIKYTGAPKVNIIGHSMGVTFGRKVIKGGITTDHSVGTYDVGPSLKDKVKTFVGLAGANLGLTACWTATAMNTCNTKDGFFPGATSASGPSVFLKQLNTNGGAEGDKVYTIWSKYDDLIMYECVVWGKVTCRIPGQTGQVEKTTPEWGHFAVRDNTGPDLYGWL